jgi:uncharacterized protein YndB with AHSA1/START domain
MFKKILLILAALVVVFLVVVAFQPSHYRVVRSATISAPPATVFPHVNDFHKWDAWSPWAKLDPAAKNTFEGPPAGTGAVFAWDGNDKVGVGRMTITESRPSDLVRIKLAFLKPFESTADTEFTFKPAGNQTTVEWSMSGEKNFISKAVCMFMSMDKMMGGEFEKGLTQLKTIAEASAKR